MLRLAIRVMGSRMLVSVTALLIAATVASACMLLNPYIDRELSGKVTLTNEWLELTPKEPLKVERDTQEVTLFPDPPIQMVFDEDSDLVPADGRAAGFEAELIGSNGATYRSSPGRSQTMTGGLKITSRSLKFKDLPGEVTYTKVRIRSSASYPVKKILWRCYTWADVHHIIALVSWLI